MFTLLSKIFIKDNKSYHDKRVREGYGMLSGILGIILNILLFAGKFVAGIITGSVSIMADGFNNLTDSGSSLITFIGFRLSRKPTDREHPFGHGRMEYVAGFIVSMFIFIVGVELIENSIKRLINPTGVQFSLMAVIILAVSLVVKLYMFGYNYCISKKIDSAAMKVSAIDSVLDAVSTALVLVSILLNHFLSWEIDGVMGILVALFILFSGFKTSKEMIGLLLGKAPDREYVKKIENMVKAQPGIIGVHDLMVHNYGPGRQIISLHAEVSSLENVNIAHDYIDSAERAVEEAFGCIAVFHMDPIVIDDPKRDKLCAMVNDIVKGINPEFSIHDFRVTIGDSNIKLIFDVTIPHADREDHKIIKDQIESAIKKVDKRYNPVCKVEHSFSGIN